MNKTTTYMKCVLIAVLTLAVQSLTAQTEPEKTYKLTTVENEHGTVAYKVNGIEATPDSDGVVKVDEGDKVTVTVTPFTGWGVESVSGAWSLGFEGAHARSSAQSNDPTVDVLDDFELTPLANKKNTYTFTMLRADVELSVNYFAMPVLTLAVNDATMGTVTLENSYSYTIEVTYGNNTTVQVVTGFPVVVDIPNNTEIGNISANAAVTFENGQVTVNAPFEGIVNAYGLHEDIVFPITCTTTQLATLVPNTNSQYYVEPNTELTLTATANENHHVASWTDANAAAYTTGITNSDYTITSPSDMFPGVSTLTLTVGTEDITAQANFDRNGYLVTVPAKEYITYYSDKPLKLLDSETDAKLYTITEVDENTATISQLSSASAGTPLMLYNGGNAEKSILLQIAPAPATPTTFAPEFVGSLTATTIAASTNTQNNYALNGRQFVWVKNALNTEANKCWLTLGDSRASALAIVSGAPAAPTATKYQLTAIADPNGRGTISFSVGGNTVSEAAQGDVVTVTVSPTTGYVVNQPSGQWTAVVAAARRAVSSTETIGVADAISLTPAGENTWTFTMIAADATLEASYKKLLSHQDITIEAIGDITYDGQQHTPIITVKDGTTDISGQCGYGYNGDLVNVGTINVTIGVLSTNEDYAGEINTSYKIVAKQLKITAQSKEFTYNGTAQSWSEYDVDGLVGNDAISAVVTGSILFPTESPVTNELTNYEFTTGTPGNYSVQTFDGELTMVNASQDITITAASGSWTYDDSAHTDATVTITTGSLFTGDELVATATGSVTNVADTNVGNNPIATGYKVKHGEEDVTANYVITTEAGTLTINKANPTLTFTPATASITFGKEGEFVKPALTTNPGGVTVTYESGNGTVATVDPENGDISPLVPGENVTIKATFAGNSNYNEGFATYTLNVVKGQAIVSAEPTTIEGLAYTGDAQALVEEGEAVNGEMQYKVGANGAYSTAIPTATGAGSYTVYFKAAGNVQFADSEEGSLTVSIGKVPLTVTAEDNDMIYGYPAPTFYAIYEGFVGDDTPEDLGGTLRFSCPYSAGMGVGQYTITPNGLTSSDYDITFVPGTLTIKEAGFIVVFKDRSVTKTVGDKPFKNELTSTLGGKVTYESSDPEVATVDNNGTVTVLRAGYTSISAFVYADSNHETMEASFWLDVEKKVIENSPGTTILWDGVEYTVEIDEDVAPGKVVAEEICDAHLSYTRTLKTDGKTAVTIDGKDSYLFTVCLPFTPYFNAKFYTLTGVNNDILYFDEIEGKPQAFTPYLVSVEHDVALRDVETVIIHIKDPNKEESDWSQAVKDFDGTRYTNKHDMSFCDEVNDGEPVDGIQLKGTLRGLSNGAGAQEGAYILQSDGSWGMVKAGNEGVYIPPFRAYVTASSTQSARLGSSVSGTPTAIGRIVTTDRDGTEHWYDLKGNRIDQPTKKGIYIHNGRKETVK